MVNPWPVALTTQRIPVRRESHRNGGSRIDAPYASVGARSGPLPSEHVRRAHTAVRPFRCRVAVYCGRNVWQYA
jgi:hypothetical protein